MGKKKVVIVGGGFGGLTCAKRLGRSDCELYLIDKTNHHLFQPLLYQVATATLAPGEIAIPIREVLRNQKNSHVIMGEVERIEKEHHSIILENGERFSYDYLILAVGAEHSYFGNDQWSSYAPGLKSIQDALSIREKILLSFEEAERENVGTEKKEPLTFIIIGGGATGVELSGAIGEIVHKTMARNFRNIDLSSTKIYLVEAANQLLSGYPENLSKAVEEQLNGLGVEVIKGKKVTHISAEGVEIAGVFYPSKNVIWAAGNQAAPLLASLNVPLDKQGRVMVEKDLSIPGNSNIFVIGDAATMKDKNERPLPGIATVAIQQAKYLAKILQKILKCSSDKQIQKLKRKPFTYRDKGMMAVIGYGKAIAKIGRIELKGFAAWLLWSFIHIIYLIGFRNRLAVVIEWVFSCCTGQRGSRLIYNSIPKSRFHLRGK